MNAADDDVMAAVAQIRALVVSLGEACFAQIRWEDATTGPVNGRIRAGTNGRGGPQRSAANVRSK